MTCSSIKCGLLVLFLFICRHSQDRQVKALKEIFNKFLSETYDEETRLRLLENFLVPMLCEACKPAVVMFYADNIQFVIDSFEDKLRLHDNDRKVQRKVAFFDQIKITFQSLFLKNLNIKLIRNVHYSIFRPSKT